MLNAVNRADRRTGRPTPSPTVGHTGTQTDHPGRPRTARPAETRAPLRTLLPGRDRNPSPPRHAL
ncbi:MAG: hypothetical protein ACK55I_33430 [bacterium]